MSWWRMSPIRRHVCQAMEFGIMKSQATMTSWHGSDTCVNGHVLILEFDVSMGKASTGELFCFRCCCWFEQSWYGVVPWRFKAIYISIINVYLVSCNIFLVDFFVSLFHHPSSSFGLPWYHMMYKRRVEHNSALVFIVGRYPLSWTVFHIINKTKRLQSNRISGSQTYTCMNSLNETSCDITFDLVMIPAKIDCLMAFS